MTYLDLVRDADRKLDTGEITLGEYERMIEPLKREMRGKWKPIGWSGRIHKCNQCGNMLDFGGVNAGRGDANFCPSCGADMREENES